MDMNNKEVSLLVIPRDVIESGNIKYTLTGLKSGSYNPIEPLHIVVDGYNNEPNELYEIPKVTKYFKRLVKRHSDWLTTSISRETIALIVQCLLVKRTESGGGLPGENLKKCYMKQNEWGELAQSWVAKSSSGLDLASHLLFDAFPTMSPFAGFSTNDQNMLLVKKMVERGYPETIEFIKNGRGAIKVLEFYESSIDVRVYLKIGNNHIYETFNLSVPDLNLEENADILRNDFSEGLHISILELKAQVKRNEKLN